MSLKIVKVLVSTGRDRCEGRVRTGEAGELAADGARDSSVIVVNCSIQCIIMCYNNIQNYQYWSRTTARYKNPLAMGKFRTYGADGAPGLG